MKFIEMKTKQQFYCYIFFLVLIYVVISQAFAIFVAHRPFWLDEWYIISNIKFKSYLEVFNHLEYTQFPRVYLVLLKAFAGLFNFSEVSLRLIPYFCGLIAIVFSYYLAGSVLYKGDKKRRLIFSLLLICNVITAYYLIQVKQYTMELLWALLAIWQYYYYSQDLQIPNRSFSQGTVAILIFLIGPFFSYTYPIAAAPTVLTLAWFWLSTKKNAATFLRFIGPILIFMV